MKRFTGLLNRTKSGSSPDAFNPNGAAVDSPEANAARSIRLFCESGSASNRDEEVLHLPVIVEAAESSPQAAQAAAQQIKRFLAKDYMSKPHVQYNSIMLIRILSDHPGPIFTRFFDQSFVKTVKELLRGCKDHSTQQILRETLDSIEVNKAEDEGVAGLVTMWRKEKGTQGSLTHAGSARRGPPKQNQNGQDDRIRSGRSGSQHQSNHRVFQRDQLPAPHELASRIEEARNTAKILLQLIQSTPRDEFLSSELAREFSERCQSAQKSMQTYINCDSPSPDDDTMLTLIETNEQLSLAGTRYQRVMLEARRALGQNTSPDPEALNDGYGAFTSPAAPGQAESLFAAAPVQRQPANSSAPLPNYGAYQDYSNHQAPPGPPPQQQPSPQQSQASYLPAANTESSNPFLDPVEHDSNPPPLAFEPTNYGRSVASGQRPINSQPTNPNANFGITSEPSFARRNTTDLENAYTASPSTESPVSPVRPGAGVTPSYLGRQVSAANGLTMHGGQGIVELDGHSTIGRSETVSTGLTAGSEGSYNVSPVQTRRYSAGLQGRRMSRVDVAGTGGLRGA